MPATENTWRSMKVMHVVFGVSALVMTWATIWLMAKDHNREWKDWQLADRGKESWMLAARRDAATDQYASQLEQLQRDLRVARSTPIDEEKIQQFESLVNEENKRLDEQAIQYVSIRFDQLDQAYETLQTASLDVAEAANAAANLGETDLEGGGQEEVAADLTAAQDNALAARSELFVAMEAFISEAKRREKELVGKKKFVNADRTAAVSELGLLVGAGAEQSEQNKVQSHINRLDDRLGELTARIAAAISYREHLESAQAEMDAEGNVFVKQIDSKQTELARLHEQAYLGTSNLGEWITRLPILDALYNGNIKIDQIWLPDLTVNFNFTQAARFDRCKTCHRAISQTAVGTPTDPAYPTVPESQRELVLSLETPAEQPATEGEGGEQLSDGERIKNGYGFVLANQGVIDYEETTVLFVVPESPAARTGLQSGDVVLQVGDVPVGKQLAQAKSQLLHNVPWGSTVALTVRRGLDHPFTSHPRLDLYLTDLSPHSEKVFGCTVCHDGQGSGTAFKWTSHTPNNADQQQSWTRSHGWFDNHHWIFPMKPKRFVESNCMKCHYNKAELVASERFPDPPAPKLVEGWTLVEQFGCFGCHDVNGFDGPNQRLGPDLRLEPNYHEAAAQMLRDDKLSDAERDWARHLVQSPDDDQVRERLYDSIDQDAQLAAGLLEEASEDGSSEKGRLATSTHELAALLKDVEIAGQYRKAGPSLRYLESKVDFDWLYSWINMPSDFRPTTKMPQFFHQWEHLDEPEDAQQKEVSERLESIEVRALSEFLLKNSSPFDYLDPPQEVTEAPSAERGQWLFESRGCLACHSHEKFPGIESSQGPDLSRVGAKFNTEKGRRWIYSWIKEPHRYHPRTKMPQLYLDPIEEKDAQGKATGRITDPAADIRLFLLGIPANWQPTDVPSRQMTAADEKALAELATEWLSSDTIPPTLAKKYLQNGIPPELSPRLNDSARLLIGIDDSNRVSRQLEYVARETVAKYGCFGCHDIPGFEATKPIGTGLADWGRKESSKLAFENIHKFLETHGVDAPGSAHFDESQVGDDHEGKGTERDHSAERAHSAEHDNSAGRSHADGGHAAGHGHLDPLDFDANESYFVQSLNSHARDGFLWQKLRMPRSYDYKTTQNKGFNERLRMPRFPFNDEQREAIMTFVLGLVNEPPAEKFIYQTDLRSEAIIQGRQVLDKFNCAGCHTMRMEEWKLEFAEDTFESPPELIDYPFLDARFSEKEIAESLQKDSRGLLHATLHGLTVRSEETGMAIRFDEDGLPLDEDDEESDPYYLFTLWQNGLVQGETWSVGVQDLLVPANRDGYGPEQGTAYPGWGGELTRYLFPRAIAHAKEASPQTKGAEAWGWLPPPLMEEGAKVQLDWLHSFLMDPITIRPAAVMRMPNFHMSSDDATRLVNYFAATSSVEFPYEFKHQQRQSYLDEQAPDLLEQAMRVITDGNYCVKCHAVADFVPQGELTTLGPNLADVAARLRPDYLRKWLANPKRILPYTGMPVNVPYNPDKPHLGGVSQDLIHGTSIQQLDGLVDLLLNFDLYTRKQTSIQSLVKPAAEVEPGATEDPGTEN